MLKCKANKWGLVYLTWNTVMLQDNNFDSHGNETKFTLMKALCTNHYATVP